jgi:hypothetical protein
MCICDQDAFESGCYHQKIEFYFIVKMDNWQLNGPDSFLLVPLVLFITQGITILLSVK